MADRTLEQGPEAKPRNYLADMVREYGLYGLSDRLNSPTSGLGLVVDAVGGLGNALFVQPAQSFNRLLTMGYESGNPQSAEDAFNVAGAAMVGGLAAPRPRAVAPKEQPLVGYRGSAYGGKSQSPTYWASSSPETAADYARAQAAYAPDGANITGQSVTPAEFRFNNPLRVDAEGQRWSDVPFRGKPASTENIARMARRDGHDGLIVSNVTDGYYGGGSPQTTIAALQPGTVYSPFTGELLYANGGKQGAMTGAAVSAAGERPATVRAYRGSNNEFDISQFDPAASNPAWRTNEGALFFGSQDVANFYGAPQTAFDQQLYRSIVQKHTKPDGRLNPQAIAKEYDEVAPQQGAASVMPADINTSNFGQANLTGYRWDADEGARLKAKIDAAKAQGKDGLIINGMMDASGYPDTQYAVWGRGNVTSPLTGETLYSGGRPGAAVGAATSAPQDNRELKSILDKYGLGNLLPRTDFARKMQPGDA